MLAVLPCHPEIKKLGVPDDHRGIDAHAVGTQGNQFFCRVQAFLRAVPGKTGHHLEDQLQTGFFHKAGGASHVFRRMASSGETQDFLIHGLGTKLHRFDPKRAEPDKGIGIDGIRSCGKTDRIDLTAKNRRMGGGKQRVLHLRRNGGEAAPIKGQLPLFPMTGKGG